MAALRSVAAFARRGNKEERQGEAENEDKCEPPSREALEFALFLDRAERAVAAVAVPACNKEEPQGEADKEDEEWEELWRLKVSAFESSLIERLDRLSAAIGTAAERYRSRIEDLVPALDRAFEQRKAAERAAAEAAAAAAAALLAPPPQPAEPAAEAVSAEAPPSPSAPAAKRADRSLPKASQASASSKDLAAPATEKPAEIPWRRKRADAPNASKPGMDVKGSIVNEMSDLTEGMKGAAHGMLFTVKKDNTKLDQISEEQQKALERVKKENEKGKALLWTGQLGFICQMMMVASSVVIFVFMLPFIFWT